MEIACLGWGSLTWRPGGLPVRSCWFKDGPMLPIEFARQSTEDRITLAITPGALPVTTLWALMDVLDLDAARSELAKRENIPKKNVERDIGYWASDGNIGGTGAGAVARWAPTKGLDAVVWTALPPKLASAHGRAPTEDEVIRFLREHGGKAAETYVRMTPRQIDTRYRKRIELEFNWIPLPATADIPPGSHPSIGD